MNEARKEVCIGQENKPLGKQKASPNVAQMLVCKEVRKIKA